MMIAVSESHGWYKNRGAEFFPHVMSPLGDRRRK